MMSVVHKTSSMILARSLTQLRCKPVANPSLSIHCDFSSKQTATLPLFSNNPSTQLPISFYHKTAASVITKRALSTDVDVSVSSSSSPEDDYLRWRKQGVLSIDEICENIKQGKGQDLIVINLADHVNYVKYFVIVTANSYRHLRAMAQSMNQLYKQKKRKEDPFTIIEGKKECRDWQCIELGNSVVHFMLEESRERYQLEKLWLLGHKFDDLLRQEPSQEDIVHELTTGGLKMMSSAEDDDVIYLSEDDIIDFPSWDDEGEPVVNNDNDDSDNIVDEDDYVV